MIWMNVRLSTDVTESSEIVNDIAHNSPRKTGSTSISFAITLKETQTSWDICNRLLTDLEHSKSQLHHLLFCWWLYLGGFHNLCTMSPAPQRIIQNQRGCCSGIDSTTGRNNIQPTLQFNLYFSHLQSSFWHEPDPSNAYSHRSEPPDLLDSSMTYQIRLWPFRYEHRIAWLNLTGPSNIYPHCHTLGSQTYVYFITFIFIWLFRLIMTPDRDLDLGFHHPPLIVLSHPA